MRILFALLFATISLCAKADEGSKALLDKMTTKITSYNSYKVEFTATMPGQFDNIKGSFVVSGDKFHIDVYDSEILSDGKTKYTYNKRDNEVIIETQDPSDNSLLANPSKIFFLYDRDFTHTLKSAGMVEFKPRQSNFPFQSIVIKVDGDNLPEELSYTLPGNKKMSLKVLKFTPNTLITPTTFTFDKAKYKGAEIIDFR